MLTQVSFTFLDGYIHSEVIVVINHAVILVPE
jgi:hypothetical protein